MKRSSRMTIQQATHDYEAWLAAHLEIVRADLELKHQHMSAAVFTFLRATYYRWAQLFPRLCPDLARAPQVLAVGDLHVENFGTWRDGEGRLVWGINDFDETWRLPYAHDLVRLATSAHLAIDGGGLRISGREACESILAGYRETLEGGGRPFVLAEHSQALRHLAMARLRDPQAFWQKLSGLPSFKGEVPSRAVKAINTLLPVPDLPRRIVHRVAGNGSLGRQRFVALCDWQGGKIAREAKALAPSAVIWAWGGDGQTKLLYQAILDQSVRAIDPWVKVRRRWIVRRLAPDCSRIELADLPEEREESLLLRAMGAETANVHLGSRTAHALLVDLASREGDWLHQAAKTMLAAVQEDWEAWCKNPKGEPVAVAAHLAPADKPSKEGAAKPAEAGAAKTGKTVQAGKAGKARKAGKAGKAKDSVHGKDGSGKAKDPVHGKDGSGKALVEAGATGKAKAAGKPAKAPGKPAKAVAKPAKAAGKATKVDAKK